MKARTLKTLEQSKATHVEKQPGTRFVETRYGSPSGIVEFNMFLTTSNDPNLRVFGSGAFEEKDLQCVAAELSKLARDFELCDAQAEGYMQAVEDAERRNE
jgi:hypothetical protein